MMEDDENWREMTVGEGDHGHGHGNKKSKFLNLKRYQVVVIGCMAVILLLLVIVVIDSFQGDDDGSGNTKPTSTPTPTPSTKQNETLSSTPTKTPDPTSTKTPKPTKASKTPKPETPTPSEEPVEEASPPIVVMVSFDGFRHTYFDAEDMSATHPTFDEMIRHGVSMPIQPVFPSLTFPNHYSLATGLYAESHGIVSNNFYDPDLNDTFAYTRPSAIDSKWWLGEPIWVTTVKQNKRSAVYFWPGSEVNISGYRPTEFKRYDGSVPIFTRIDTAIEWAHLPLETRPSLIMVYMEPVDHAGHSNGPNDHAAIGAAISEVDAALLRLKTGLSDVKNLTLLLVSDHGMAQIINEPYAISSLVNSTLLNNTIWPAKSGPFVHIFPPADMEPLHVDSWATSFKKNVSASVSQKRFNMTIYKKSDIPARYHYQNSNRIPPIVAVADNGYYLSRDPAPAPMKGAHGYDNLASDMQGIFIASGPLFKNGYASEESLPNIDIYNIVCHILGLSPAPNNGTNPTTLPFWK